MTASPDFDALAKEATARLSEYLRIDTVNPPGNETRGATYLRDALAADGVASEIFESAPGRGNVYARLRGTGAQRPLILLSHIDVVPFEADQWAVEPLSGVVKDGYIWGRGALDMKGHGIMNLMTLLALKRRGVPLSRDLVFIANADEETGSTGAIWFTREKADLIRDTEFLINEGGKNPIGRSGRVNYYGIDLTEKAPFWLRLVARGRPGHGARPTTDNPVLRLARVLGRLAAFETPLQLTPPAEQFFKQLASREEDMRRKAWLADPGGALGSPEGIAFFTSDNYYNAVLRNTISITGMRGSEKTNIIPGEASVDLDVRLLPGQDPQGFLAELKGVIADDAVEVVFLSPPRTSNASPLEGDVVTAVQEAVARLDPGALVATPMLTGYTDSYYYRMLGIHSYGIEPFRTAEEEYRGVHGHNERVSLENIRWGVEWFYRIVERVAR